MKYASRDKKALSEIAVIDEEFIAHVVRNIPPGSGTYTHPSTHPATMITQDTTHNFVTTTEKNNFHASGSDNQDLSGLVEKVTGKGLSANDFTDTLKGYYDGAYSHSQATHAPAAAQVNNISDVNAGLLTGGQEITLHSHAGGSGLSQAQVRRLTRR